jgi:hypothetical protein
MKPITFVGFVFVGCCAAAVQANADANAAAARNLRVFPIFILVHSSFYGIAEGQEAIRIHTFAERG